MMLRLPWVETSASETPLPLTRAVDDAGRLLELGLRDGVALLDRRQGDPGAALEVEPQLWLPGLAERGQSVEHDDGQPEDDQRAHGTGRLLRHGDVSPQSSVLFGSGSPGRSIVSGSSSPVSAAGVVVSSSSTRRTTTWRATVITVPGRHLELDPSLGQRANGAEDPRGQYDLLADLELTLQLLDPLLLVTGGPHDDGPEAEHGHDDHKQLHGGRHDRQLQGKGTGLGVPCIPTERAIGSSTGTGTTPNVKCNGRHRLIRTPTRTGSGRPRPHRRGGASPRCAHAAGRGHPAPRGTGQEALAHQERLGDLLDGLALLAHRDGQRAHARPGHRRTGGRARRARHGRGGRDRTRRPRTAPAPRERGLG